MSTAPFSTFFLFIITINHRTCMYVQIQLAIMLMHSIMLLVFYFNPPYTTGGALFAEGPGHSAKALPSAALGKEPSEKNLTAKRLFAEGQLSGTRQSIFRGPTAALGKEKQPSTALLR